MVPDSTGPRPLEAVAWRDEARQAGELDAAPLRREESPPLIAIVLGGGDLDEPTLAALDLRAAKRLWGRLSLLIAEWQGGVL